MSDISILLQHHHQTESDDDFVIKSKYYSLTFLFDSYFGFQDANLRLCFVLYFLKLSAGIGFWSK